MKRSLAIVEPPITFHKLDLKSAELWAPTRWLRDPTQGDTDSLTETQQEWHWHWLLWLKQNACDPPWPHNSHAHFVPLPLGSCNHGQQPRLCSSLFSFYQNYCPSFTPEIESFPSSFSSLLDHISLLLFYFSQLS